MRKGIARIKFSNMYWFNIHDTFTVVGKSVKIVSMSFLVAVVK